MGEILEAEGGTPEVRQVPDHCIGGPVTGTELAADREDTAVLSCSGA